MSLCRGDNVDGETREAREQGPDPGLHTRRAGRAGQSRQLARPGRAAAGRRGRAGAQLVSPAFLITETG